MSAVKIEPYLNFAGRCEEAVAFYQTAIGAHMEFMMRFKDSPDPLPPGMVPPGHENRVMHVSLRVGDSILMASDGCDNEHKFSGFSLSLAYMSAEEAQQVFAALGEGGKVEMPLGKTFWAPLFGMVTDKFGVTWMVSQHGAPSA